MGERFVAFALVAGVRIKSVTVDRRTTERSLVDFEVGDASAEHRLPLSEFRRRLAATLLTEEEEDVPTELGSDPPPEDVQTFIGLRSLLLSPVFGFRLTELVVGGDEPAVVRLEAEGAQVELLLEDFRREIRDRVQQEVERFRASEPFAIDLLVIPEAERASGEEDWDRVVTLLGAWPGPLSMLLRTPEGAQLSGSVRGTLARALGLLGTAYGQLDRLDWAEEVIRLGIQWAQDGPAAGDLFRRLGETYLARNRHGEAIGVFRRALALGEPGRVVLPPLAECFLARGRLVAAAVCADEAEAHGSDPGLLEEIREEVKDRLGPAWESFRRAVPTTSSEEVTLRPPQGFVR